MDGHSSWGRAGDDRPTSGHPDGGAWYGDQGWRDAVDEPERYADQPERYREHPERYGDRPERYPDQAGRYGDGPERYDEPPEPYEESRRTEPGAGELPRITPVRHDPGPVDPPRVNPIVPGRPGGPQVPLSAVRAVPPPGAPASPAQPAAAAPVGPPAPPVTPAAARRPASAPGSPGPVGGVEGGGVYRSRRPATAALFGVVAAVLEIPALLLLRAATFDDPISVSGVVAAACLVGALPLAAVGLYAVATGAVRAAGPNSVQAWLRPPVAYLTVALVLFVAAGLAA